MLDLYPNSVPKQNKKWWLQEEYTYNLFLVGAPIKFDWCLYAY